MFWNPFVFKKDEPYLRMNAQNQDKEELEEKEPVWTNFINWYVITSLRIPLKDT